MILTRRGALGAFAAASLATLAACGSDAGSSSSSTGSGSGGDYSGSIKGAGATSQADAQTAWMNAFMDANPDATVEYAGGGSGAGVTKFTEGAVDYAGTDSPLKAEDITAAGGQVVELPLYISPIAVAYNVPGFTGDTHVNMTGEVIAKVFNGEITRWNDQAIAALNEGASLPDLAIVTVHRSDESGTSENFAKYLADVAPEVWTEDASGDWPTAYVGEAAKGTSGVVDAVKSGTNTIGYADAGQAPDLDHVQVKVGDQHFGPEAEAAAKLVDNASKVEGRGEHDWALKLDRKAEDQYPIALVAYAMVCE